MRYDQNAGFDTIFKSKYSALCHYARKYVRNKFDADCVVTDVFVMAWLKQKEGCFRNVQSMIAFLYISTRNAAINHYRKRKTKARLQKDFGTCFNEGDEYPIQEDQREELIKKIRALAEQLPPQCRKVVLFYYWKGLAHKQIAQKLKLSVRTVINHKSKGIKFIKSKLSLLQFEGEKLY